MQKSKLNKLHFSESKIMRKILVHIRFKLATWGDTC